VNIKRKLKKPVQEIRAVKKNQDDKKCKVKLYENYNIKEEANYQQMDF
jgi:hypothetical protein